MIDVFKYKLDYLETIWLFEFIPGGAGDFFISLASLCSNDHVITVPDIKFRMEEFKNTGKMPGNNVGTKLIYHKNISELQKQIEDHLSKIQKTGWTGLSTQMSMCTHPGTVKNLYEDLQTLFPKQTINKVCLTATTKQSRKFISYYYGTPEDRILELQADMMLWDDPLESLVLDSTDLALNNTKELKESAEYIAGSLNESMYEYIFDIYNDVKLKPFKDWYNGTQSVH